MTDITLPEVEVTAKPPETKFSGSAPTYTERLITVTFQLGKGDFGEKGQNRITFSGLRIHVQVEQATVPTTGNAVIRVFGMSLEHMNSLSKAGLLYAARNNAVLVQAGDAIEGMTTVFNGIIIEAYPDMNAQPEVFFFVRASPSNIIQLKPVPPSSFTGGTDGATALRAILAKTDYTLENNGVNVVLSSPYFPGTAWNQILSIVGAMNCFAHIDGINKVLAIWPKDGKRAGDSVLVSAATGMIGYPSFQSTQVVVRKLYSKGGIPELGQPFKISSDLQAANGNFSAVGVSLELMSQMPDGPWEAVITGTVPGNNQV